MWLLGAVGRKMAPVWVKHLQMCTLPDRGSDNAVRLHSHRGTAGLVKSTLKTRKGQTEQIRAHHCIDAQKKGKADNITISDRQKYINPYLFTDSFISTHSIDNCCLEGKKRFTSFSEFNYSVKCID